MKNIHRKLVEKNGWYASWHQNSNYSITHTFLLLIFVSFVFLTLSSTSKVDRSSLVGSAYQPFNDLSFCNRMTNVKGLSQSEAVRALGSSIDRVGRHYGLDGEKLKKGFENDKNLRVNCDGLLFFTENDIPQGATPGDGNIPNNPTISEIPDSATFVLHSRPNATAKIYLNFVGGVITSQVWNGGAPITTLPFSVDTDPAFSPDELNRIKSIWRNVAEDFSAFDVDITTEKPLNPDLNHYTQLILTPSHQWYGTTSGGVAYVGSFRWGNDTPAFAFTSLLNNNTKYLAEVASHEVGHTMGLSHVSKYDSACTFLNTYYSGAGSPGWAPIMGNSYYAQVTHWTNTNDSPVMATPYGCTSEQVEPTIITSATTNGGDLRFVSDETGGTTATAIGLPHTLSGGIASVNYGGTLTLNDTDIYKVNTTGGNLQFSVLPMTPVMANIVGNADFRVRLLNSNLDVLSEINSDRVAISTVTATEVPAGVYYVEISTSGYLDPLQAGGYSTAGSMGQYQITGTYTPAADTISPTVSITSPIGGVSVSGNVTISASATDNNSVSQIDFYVDNVFVSSDLTSPYTSIWNTSTVSSGAHILTAKAYDSSNNTTTSQGVSVVVDNIAPTVTISSPVNGYIITTRTSTVAINGVSTDNRAVVRMEIFIDNVLVKSSTTGPVSYSWNVKKLSRGSHTVTIKGYDAAGNIGQKSITVTK